MLQQFQIVLVHVNRRSGPLLQLFCAAYVIDVRVGDGDEFHLQAVASEKLHDFVDVVARIDNNCLMRGFVAQHRAVALQPAHWQNFVNHMHEKYNTLKVMSRLLAAAGSLPKPLGFPC